MDFNQNKYLQETMGCLTVRIGYSKNNGFASFGSTDRSTPKMVLKMKYLCLFMLAPGTRDLSVTKWVHIKKYGLEMNGPCPDDFPSLFYFPPNPEITKLGPNSRSVLFENIGLSSKFICSTNTTLFLER